jgi:hypothetical protein
LTSRPSLLVRVLIVLASACLVAAFALATLLPPLLPLRTALAQLDHDALVGVQDFTRLRIAGWLWDWFAVPLLARPTWLVPVALALVFAATAATVASRRSLTQSQRRRG